MTLSSMNIQMFRWINSGAGTHPVVDGLAIFFGQVGPYFLAVLFVVLWFLSEESKKKTLLEATEAAILGLLFNQFIGFFYFHPRPYMMGLCTPLFLHVTDSSFPSDHATLMFAASFYLIPARRWAACGVPLLIVAVLTAWGRVYSGIHFPLDIIGSIAVGFMSAGFICLLAKRLNPSNERLIRIADQLRKRFARIIKQ